MSNSKGTEHHIEYGLPNCNPSQFAVSNGVLIKYLGNSSTVDVPDIVAQISSSAFIGCAEVTKIIIPDTVKKIDRYSFVSCTSLKIIQIGFGVSVIPMGAFAELPNLESVILTDSISKIEDFAFRNCKNLVSLEFLTKKYRDPVTAVETELLTVEEYAYSTNETVFKVKKCIESAMLLVEFLEYIHMPKQYHIARDYQVVSVITDLQSLLRKCATPEMQEKVKNAVFANIMMRAIGDSRKYIRNLSQMMDTGFFTAYIKDQERIGEVLREDLDEATPEGKRDLDFFVSTHEEAAENLQMSLDRSLLKAKKHETRNKPSRIVSKSITLLKDVDTNIFEKLTDSEKENLRGQLDRLTSVAEHFNTMMDAKSPKPTEPVKEEPVVPVIRKIVSNVQSKQRFYIARRHFDEPFVNCFSVGKIISNLGFTVEFQPTQITNGQKENFSYRAFFIDESNEIISNKLYACFAVIQRRCR